MTDRPNHLPISKKLPLSNSVSITGRTLYAFRGSRGMAVAHFSSRRSTGSRLRIAAGMSCTDDGR